MIDLKSLSDDDLRTLRKTTKNRIARFGTIQMVRKVCLNSAYGAVGADSFRYFDPRQAEAVTLSGQMVIRLVEQELNLFLNRILKTPKPFDFVIAGDTDSCYLNLKQVADMAAQNGASQDKIIDAINWFCQKKVEPEIKRIFDKIQHDFAVPNNILVMKREAIADKGVWRAKKHYILNVLDSEGTRLAEPKMKMKGIEAVRSNTPVACRSHLKKCLEILLRGTQQQMWDYVAGVKSTFYSLPFEDVATPTGVNGLEDYAGAESGTWNKGAPIHVKGALVYNHLLRTEKLDTKYDLIQSHDKIKFAVLKLPNFTFSPVIAAPDGLPPEWIDRIQPVIDYDRQLARSFLDPLEGIVSCAGWTIEPKGSLEDLFS